MPLYAAKTEVFNCRLSREEMNRFDALVEWHNTHRVEDFYPHKVNRTSLFLRLLRQEEIRLEDEAARTTEAIEAATGKPRRGRQVIEITNENPALPVVQSKRRKRRAKKRRAA